MSFKSSNKSLHAKCGCGHDMWLAIHNSKLFRINLTTVKTVRSRMIPCITHASKLPLTLLR